MTSHRPGRPAKPASKRRQQLHISLYPEDIRRLDALTDNRSEFLRQCIAKAWAEKHDGEVTLTVKLPRRLLHGLLTSASVSAPPQHAGALQTLIDQVITEEVVAEGMAQPGTANQGLRIGQGEIEGEFESEFENEEEDEGTVNGANGVALLRTGG